MLGVALSLLEITVWVLAIVVLAQAYAVLKLLKIYLKIRLNL